MASVLCVEDNNLNMLVMKHVVRRLENVRLWEAVTAEEGLNIALNEDIDLIIMDIQLPGMDGYEALLQLQNNERTCNIPVIALSSYAEKKDIERGLSAGFTEYVTKPIRAGQFLELLKGLLQIQESGIK